MRELKIGMLVQVKWLDSCIESGWTFTPEYKLAKAKITSWGKIIAMDDEFIALAHNYGMESDNFSEQVNGVMSIPIRSILTIDEITYYNK